ncbi:MAG TPA: MFS transporter [Microlunatus sp.]|nr:MFS transporter [Microlunatus sp.]
MSTPKTPVLDLSQRGDRTFLHLLVNVLIVSVINMTVFFAITFWTFIVTQSVLATGMIAGIFLVCTAASGIWFGSLVDHHRKKLVMQASVVVSLAFYVAAFAVYVLVPESTFTRASSVLLWVFVVLAMFGVIAGNIRMIAMMTLVTLLIPQERRDRANGLVGTATGVAFLTTSVISGLLVARDGMFSVLLLTMVVLVIGLVHLGLQDVDESRAAELSSHGDGDAPDPAAGKVDLRGTVRQVRLIPGMLALIAFSCLNNFLGGAFMALMDAYGLSMMSVQAWGLLWGGLSAFFIVGGLLVAKTGLTSQPLRLLLLINLVLWSVTALFPLQASIVMLTIGMAFYMILIPYAEAAEQTILQRVVPFERQGRVFGFAQSVEQAASPLTAFMIGPLTQLIFIPFMTDGAGAELIGGWFGTGPARGIALVFVLVGVLGVLLTIYALNSKYYRQLSARYAESDPQPTETTEPEGDLTPDPASDPRL